MDTLGIEAFLAVVRYGSITEAANSLFLSQSTLSHRLAELERAVGVNLIERGRGQRSLSLTDYGKEFLTIARRWEDLVHDTPFQLQSRVRNLTLAIGAVDTIHTYVLPPFYRALRQCGKELSLRLRTHNSTQLYLQIDRGELDVAFPLLDLPMRNIVVEKILYRSQSYRPPGTGACSKQRLYRSSQPRSGGRGIFRRRPGVPGLA